MDNYFRVARHVFPFNSNISSSIETAFAAAVLVGNPVVYRPVPVAGPWDRCELVGHRNRTKIQRDLCIETDEDEIERLHEELTALHVTWAEAGRAIPLMAVAA